MKAVIYTRVSTDSQETERQVMECKELCKIYNYEVIEVIQETGSGFKNDRIGMERLMRIVESGGCEVVVVYELSRLGRTNEVINIVRTFDEHFVSLHTKVYGIQTNPREVSSFINPVIGIMVALSHSEAAIFKQRSSSGIRKIAMEGKALGSTNYPYGYTKREVKGYLEVEPTEADVVREIYQLYLGGKGTLQIKRELNDRGVPTRNNKKWSEHLVYSILTNPIYIGKRRFKGELFDLQQFRIMDDETWNEVNRRLKGNYSKLGKHIKHNYLIDRTKTKIYCGVCGKTYYPHKRMDNKDNRYICISKRYQEDCGNFGISIPKLEKSVQLMLIHHFSATLLKKLDNKLIRQQIEEHIESIEHLEKEGDKLLKTQTDVIKERFGGVMPEDAYQVVMSDINRKREDNRNRLEHTRAKLDDLKKTYENIMDLKRLEQQLKQNVNFPSEMVNRIVKKITITKELQPPPQFTKPYDKVVRVKLEAGTDGNQVTYWISQREGFMYDLQKRRTYPIS